MLRSPFVRWTLLAVIVVAVLGIVRGHGGTLHLETAPGRGSRFRVYLPACEPLAPATTKKRRSK